jgi:hypothetical protein
MDAETDTDPIMVGYIYRVGFWIPESQSSWRGHLGYIYPQ